MKKVLKSIIIGIMHVCIASTVFAQPNITDAEYFFDNDPGFGNGTAITISSPAVNISSLSFNAGVSSLSNGMHTLFVRSKNANGAWSVTNKMYIAKVQTLGGNPNSISNIVAAEYFYDTDPGFGNGMSITITPSNDITSLVFNANVSALSGGMHTLYTRTQDAQGKWSITQKYYFAKFQPLSSSPHSTSNIVSAEYFFDNDPGYGNGSSITLTPAPDISSLAFNANVASLSNGVHSLYARTKDAQGQWSQTQRFYFAKVQPLGANPNSVSNITKAEYFFNTDPGFGNGVNIPVSAATDINGFVANLDVSMLFTGLHTLFVRTMDAQGKWSITTSWQFSRIQGLSPNPYQLSRINKAEYFYDVDPGYGNGTDIPVVPGYDISSLTFNADVTALSNGMHTMYVRTRDSLGQWGTTNNFYFAKVQSLGTNPHSISNIVKAEYYYDSDPGFGNATDVPVTANTDIASFAFNADASLLSNGVHTLFLRIKDAQDKWSVVNKVIFAKVQPLSGNPHTLSNIVQAEYFLDTDPGFGNATQVPVTLPAVDISGINFNVDLTFVVNGAHKLYVRTKDAEGKWSITNIHPFNGGSIPTAIELLSFEAKLQKDNKVMLEWIVASETNVARYEIERSTDASNWQFVGEKKPISANSSERRTYSLLDENPGRGIVYYRLTEHDLSGKKTIAPIRFVRISDEQLVNTVIFPNPNDGKMVNIQSPVFKEGEVEVSIISTDGKMFYKQTVKSNSTDMFTLSNLNLPSATYFINLKTNNQAQSLKLQVLNEE